jgi:hypothetical protein
LSERAYKTAVRKGLSEAGGSMASSGRSSSICKRREREEGCKRDRRVEGGRKQGAAVGKGKCMAPSLSL